MLTHITSIRAVRRCLNKSHKYCISRSFSYVNEFDVQDQAIERQDRSPYQMLKSALFSCSYLRSGRWINKKNSRWNWQNFPNLTWHFSSVNFQTTQSVIPAWLNNFTIELSFEEFSEFYFHFLLHDTFHSALENKIFYFRSSSSAVRFISWLEMISCTAKSIIFIFLKRNVETIS